MVNVETVAGVLGDLGLGVASNAIYDYLRDRFKGKSSVSHIELQESLGDYLKLNGVNVQAETVMEMLAHRGVLQITNSNLFARTRVVTGADSGAVFSVGNETVLRTNNTAITMGKGAYMKGSNAAVVQHPDGSITFHVGDK